MPAWMKRNVAGVPVGVWLLIIVVGVGVGIWIRRRAVDPVAEEDVEGVGGYESEDGSVVPVDYLPSEDQGYFPITGGGWPVAGSSAIRLEGPTRPIRIIIRQKGAGKKKKKGRNTATRQAFGNFEQREGIANPPALKRGRFQPRRYGDPVIRGRQPL